MNTHNLCFEQKHEEYQNFCHLVVKFSIYLNRCVFIMLSIISHIILTIVTEQQGHLQT